MAGIATVQTGKITSTVHSKLNRGLLSPVQAGHGAPRAGPAGTACAGGRGGGAARLLWRNGEALGPGPLVHALPPVARLPRSCPVCGVPCGGACRKGLRAHPLPDLLPPPPVQLEVAVELAGEAQPLQAFYGYPGPFGAFSLGLLNDTATAALPLGLASPLNACGTVEPPPAPGAAAVVARGNCSFTEKAWALQHAGWGAMLLFNTAEGGLCLAGCLLPLGRLGRGCVLGRAGDDAKFAICCLVSVLPLLAARTLYCAGWSLPTTTTSPARPLAQSACSCRRHATKPRAWRWRWPA